MRALALVIALALPALAQTGPTPEGVAAARAACMVEVRRECLFTLAIAAALQENREDGMHRSLNWIAGVQARAGDIAGAERTLALTEPGEDALLALGRWDEAYAVAERRFPDTIVEQGSAEGSFKIGMVRRMLEMGEIDLALTTARSIPEGWGERDDALFFIFDHYLRQADFPSAIRILDVMKDRDSFRRGQALSALVTALAIAGQTDTALGILEQADGTRAAAEARLEVAKALLAAGNPKAAHQFDLILATATDRGSYEWGPRLLIDAADAAVTLGAPDLAKPFAEAAFAVLDQDRKDTRPGRIRNISNPPDMIRVATLLRLSGSTIRGDDMLAEAALPKPGEYRDIGAWLLADLLISQLRLGDADNATATLRDLLALGEGPAEWAVNAALRDAALRLVGYGHLQDAQRLAEALETQPFAGGQSHAIFMAIMARDPGLAPTLLPGIQAAYVHLDVSVLQAKALLDQGKTAEAKEILHTLTIDHAARGEADYPLPSYKARAMADIARAQDELGFPADAAATRLRGLAFANEPALPGHQVDAYLSLATSFP